MTELNGTNIYFIFSADPWNWTFKMPLFAPLTPISRSRYNNDGGFMFNLINGMKALAIHTTFGNSLDTRSYVYLRN